MASDDTWSTPLRLRLRDGRIWQGAEFGDGFVCLHHPDEPNICTVAVSLDGLLDDLPPEHELSGVVVERPNS